MAFSHLSLPIHLPDAESEQYNRLKELTTHVANRVLSDYWMPEHMTGIGTSSHKAYKYFDEQNAFEEFDIYLPSRYKRCVLQKVGETLRSHADKREAFLAIQPILPVHKIRRIHSRRIKQTLWNTGEYLSSSYVDVLIKQLNAYYDVHGRYPSSYFDLQDGPSYDSGVLPYSTDDGPTSGQSVKYDYNETTETLTVELKTPDTLTPETRSDWTWTTYELNGYDAFHNLLDNGSLSAPLFHPTVTKTGRVYYELSFPIEVEHTEKSEEVETVLAIDSGLRKDVTAVVVNRDGEQLSTPHFIQQTNRESMQRLHRERTQLNNQLSHLRRQGRDHTDRFKSVQAEYERINNKITNKREQLVHDVSNQVLALALVYAVDVIVHEDLRSLSPPRGEGQLSWELSSWARRDIISKIEYRANIAGIHIENMFPQSTSRSCPRCGSTGHTTTSPDHDNEVWWGGHFKCDNARCSYQADRDYVGAVNVARVFFSDTDSLDHGFTSSYIGDSEIVLARRSAGERISDSQSSSRQCRDSGTRLVFGSAPVAYEPEQSRVTAGGGSAVIAPAVTSTETINDNSTNSASSPATFGVTRFTRITSNCYRK
jgi:putative transposase